MSTTAIRVFATLLVAASVSACTRKPATETGAATKDSATAPAPKTTADSTTAGPALRGTDWRLVALADKPVTMVDSNRAARILLQPDSKQLAGSGGCNRLFGVYELNREKLRFSGVGSTKMACKDGMDTEAAFVPALLRVAGWKVTGQQLELSDSTGAVLARFEARAK